MGHAHSCPYWGQEGRAVLLPREGRVSGQSLGCKLLPTQQVSLERTDSGMGYLSASLSRPSLEPWGDQSFWRACPRAGRCRPSLLLWAAQARPGRRRRHTVTPERGSRGALCPSPAIYRRKHSFQESLRGTKAKVAMVQMAHGGVCVRGGQLHPRLGERKSSAKGQKQVSEKAEVCVSLLDCFHGCWAGSRMG